MNALKLRADAHEMGYALDEKQEFLASARRNKRFGQWAGEVLGKADVEAYADAVVLSGLERRNGEFAHVRRDFDAAGIKVSDEDIHARMSAMLLEVLAELRRA
ncbi:ATPase inhibitor subunit zeta [Rhizobiaceae bacterium BDR2-2]|uniref:ATPase inhibitor subunit zeta n=1 Tax=Ectorhizobium quercum TaxID=2965071 RepID=A0AAE3N0U5_9HYPH|nr:ATPase inhibitor subunit zeta [Ectorhizobium quercum]MCX8997816.1 ATPase inhibitor subunit zeta [Ectorhizobium quercum]